MNRFQSPFGFVALSRERLEHILIYHPEIKRLIPYIAKTLAEPEFVVPSEKDASVVICYRSIEKSRRYLAVVIKTGKRRFVMTAYSTKKPKSAIL